MAGLETPRDGNGGVDPVIGIDLGTTNSAVAHIAGDTPRLIPNALGELLTPSVVGIDLDDKLLIGRTAKELQVTHPERCASLFKRRMGTDWTTRLGGKVFTPEELSSLVLRSLKQDAEAYFERRIERAVVTVPAYFNEHQRKATLHAGRIAGLRVERIFNEPTAAALAYGLHNAEEERVLLVFDLGGGTFDVSVVEIMEGAVEVRASSGEGFLGGEDFTLALAARILDRRGMHFERAEAEAPLQVSRLIQQCELAKIALSRQDSAVIRIPDRRGELGLDAPSEAVTREQFERWTESTLARVDLPIRRALGDAKLKRTDIDQVILVGGATRMPGVVARVAALFDQEPLCRLDPDHVVALGAAIQGGLIGREEGLEDLVVTDVAPFSLGVEISKRLGFEHRSGYFLPVINRNTTIPVSRVQTVSTLRSNQSEVDVHIYQGESRKVEDNLLLGVFKVTGIPRGPAGQEIEIRFTYDLNGVLEVEATVLSTRTTFVHLVTKHAKGMSPEQVARAVAAMQSLKTHPREEAPNRLMLRRAERLYGELPAEAQAQLGELLDGFESAMELGDPETIEKFRDALDRFLDVFDRGLDTGPGGDDGAW